MPIHIPQDHTALKAAGKELEGRLDSRLLAKRWAVLGFLVLTIKNIAQWEREPPASLAISHQDYDSYAHLEEMEMMTILSWKRASGKRILIETTTNDRAPCCP